MKSRLIFEQDALEPDKFLAMCAAWTEILQRTVPVEKLNDMYLYVMDYRDSHYPLLPTELSKAWKSQPGRFRM